MTVVGAVFTLVAAVFIVVGVGIVASGGGVMGLFFVLFPLIHLVVGVGLLRHTWGARAIRRRLYQEGVAATATIDRVGQNTNLAVNGRHPDEIGWTFFVDDQPFHGKRSAMNLPVHRITEGDRIWVLYDPHDPTKSVEYPPL